MKYVEGETLESIIARLRERDEETQAKYRFEQRAELIIQVLRALSAAHAKGIWVMVDVVGNHMGGQIGDVGGYAPFNQPDHYHDCQGCDGNCDITDFNTLYSENCEHCRLSGLPDLDQDNGYVKQQLNAWVGSQKIMGRNPRRFPWVSVERLFWGYFLKGLGL